MNANRSCGLKAGLACFALATGLLAPGTSRAEVGVAIQPGGALPLTTYVLDGLTEDPGPINGVWKKLGTDELPRITLNAAGEANGDGMPSLVSDPSTGLVVAAWARNSTAGFDVVVSRFANGAWTTPFVVAGSTAPELDPQLVLDPNGSVHLFYWVDGVLPQVFHVEAPADLSSWSAPLRVSDVTEPSCRPAGAYFGGVLRVAYEVHNFGVGHAPREIVLARFDNGAFTPEVVAITNNLGALYPEVHAHAGKMWVDWVDSEDSAGAGELAWTRLNAQSQWEPIQYEPFGNYEQREHLVRGAARMHAITTP